MYLSLYLLVACVWTGLEFLGSLGKIPRDRWEPDAPVIIIASIVAGLLWPISLVGTIVYHVYWWVRGRE